MWRPGQALASLCTALQLLADAIGLCAVVDDRLLEPRVLKSLLGSNAVLWIVDKDPLEQIEELSVEARVRGDELLEVCVSDMIVEREGL